MSTTEQKQPETIAQLPERGQRATIADGFRTRTKGEQLFNRLTYTGVGYFGVTAVSVFLTWLLRDNPTTSPAFTKLTNNAKERWPRYASLINSNATIATLFAGGTIVSVLPIKWLEDNKASIVKKFDRNYYGDDKVNNDPTIKAAHEEMEHLPKQTWGSVFGSRVIAFGATLGTFFLLGSNKSPVAKATGESIDRRSIEFGRWADKSLNKGNPKIVSQIEEVTRVNKQMTDTGIELLREGPAPDRIGSRIWSYIALDGFYSVITSATLFAFTRILAPVLGKKATTPKAAHEAPTPQEVKQHPAETPATPEVAPENGKTPSPRVSETTHQMRLANAPAQEITA